MSNRLRVARCAVAVATSIAVVACISSTTINSRPQGARLFLNGQPVGVTPYTMSDTKIVGTSTMLRLEAPGYEPVNTVIVRNEQFDVGACIGGVLVLVPFLWIMGYTPMRMFEMQPVGSTPWAPPGYPQPGAPPPGYPQQPQPPPPAGYPPPPAGYPPPPPAQ